MVNKIDSNATGLRYAEEASLKTLPGSPVWYGLEPNSYSDFGGNIVQVSRNPINDIRQNIKGVVTDLDASGGFNTDLTQDNLIRLLQGFLFAAIREKYTNQSLSGSPAYAITSVVNSTNDYKAASGLNNFLVNHLVFASGFTDPANNGLAKVTTAGAAALVVTGRTLVDETPATDAKLQAVGYEFASATLNVDASGTLPKLTRASGAFDFTTLGLIAGEWIYCGGDVSANTFNTAGNIGFMRVKSVAASYIEIDKSETTLVTETGTGKTIRIFFGNVIKNEGTSNLIVRKTYQIERTLGNDGGGTASEYLVGAVPNSLKLDVKTADKISADLGFVGLDAEQRTGATGVKSGSRPSISETDAFNTSSDVRRSKMNVVSSTDENPTSLFGYITEMSLSIDNGVKPTKAIGVLGGFDTSAGNFNVSGNVTAYFSSIDAITAIRNNSDVTMDLILSKNNAGMVLDIPLLSLGEGRLSIQQDQPITLPLGVNAVKNSNSYTLLFNEFRYLPTAAM